MALVVKRSETVTGLSLADVVAIAESWGAPLAEVDVEVERAGYAMYLAAITWYGEEEHTL